ncbi:MAG: hypothetical protein ABIQ44_07880 [Chloroflexia bacterium]
MVAYFVRLIAGWIAGWLLLMLVAYSLLVPINNPGEIWVCEDCNMNLMRASYEANFGLDKPWPLNYLSWVVGSNSELVREYTNVGHYVLGGNFVPTQTYQFVRVGVLGDLLERPITIGLALLFAISALILMSFVILQRIGHKPFSHRPCRQRILMSTYLLATSATRAF